MNDPDYLDSAQYEALRRLGPGSSRAERSRGGGPTYLKPTARRVLYKRSAVIEWMERNAFTSTSEEKAQRAGGPRPGRMKRERP